MICELIYTSASDTLDGPGYGVVAKTKGMPSRLEEFLRDLNRYDFDLSSAGEAGHEGPVVSSLTTLGEGPEAWHVLSRVGFGGHDYTRRAVFLAHHVALTPDELGGARAVDLLRSPSLFVERWAERPGLLPARPGLPRVRAARGCDAWRAVAGDPGWARAWVDLWASQVGEPCFLITPRGADVLAMFAEAAALLEPGRADRVGFITHLNSDRPGAGFDWIGLTAGSKLALSTAERLPGRTLDLGRPPAAPPPASRKSPQPRTKARPHRAPTRVALPGSPDRWAEDLLGTVDRPSSESRPHSASLPGPPPPPPVPIARGWVRPLTLGGGAAFASTLCGLALGVGLGNRFAKETPKGAVVEGTPAIAAVEAGPMTPSDSVGGRGRAPYLPSVVRRPGPEPVPANSGRDRPEPPATPIVAAQVPDARVAGESRARRKVRPTDQWPLLQMARSGKQPVTIARLEGGHLSRIRLLTPGGSGLECEPVEGLRSGDDGPGIEVVFRSPTAPQERVRFYLAEEAGPAPAEPAGSTATGPSLSAAATLKARVVSESATTLLRRLQLCLIRVGDPMLRGVSPDPETDVFFAPILPELPISGPWSCADRAIGDGAIDFFLAVEEAVKRERPLDVEFRLDRVSLAINPAGDPGWPLVPSGPRSADQGGPAWAWSSGGQLDATFEVARRDAGAGNPRSFDLKVATDFDRADARSTQPGPIVATLATKGHGKDAEAAPEAKAEAVAPEGKGEGPEAESPSPEKPLDTDPGRSASPKRSKKKPADRPSASLAVPAPLPEADFLLEVLRRYGRANGSIRVPLVDPALANADAAVEWIEIVKFDAATPTTTH